jgi:NADH-quinone oxidoreductase subunit L
MTAVPWLVWVIPLVGAVLVPLVERLRRDFCRWFAVAVVAVSAVLCLDQALSFTAPYVGTLGWSLYSGVEAEVYVDGLSVLLALFVSSLSLVILVYAAGMMAKEEGQARFYSLMLAFIGSMIGLVMSGDLVQFYLLWELLGICSALLIAFWWDREPARKAGLKAFLFTRVGDVALLIGVVLVLADLHTTDISSVLSAFGGSKGGVDWTLIGVLFLVGAMGKSAQVPLHVWLPDAMEGPTPVSALIHAATMVNAGVFLVVRFSPIYAASTLLSNSLIAVGLVSLLVGGACAAAATDIKRVLAYSTISQLGLMFAAVGLGSVAGAVYLLIGQGIFKALAFMAAGSVAEATGTRDILSMGGLAGKMKVTYSGFLVSALAMAGFPPFFGFWTKEVVASSAQSTNMLAFAAILLGSAFSAFYMFRVVMRVFHGQVKHPQAHEPGGMMLGPIIILGVTATVGWVAVAYQSLYLPALDLNPDILTAVVSVCVAASALLLCYATFIARPAAILGFSGSNPAVRGIISALRSGLGFDAFYSAAFQNVYLPLSRLVTRMQTGDLGNNVALLLAAIVLTLVISLLVVA